MKYWIYPYTPLMKPEDYTAFARLKSWGGGMIASILRLPEAPQILPPVTLSICPYCGEASWERVQLFSPRLFPWIQE